MFQVGDLVVIINDTNNYIYKIRAIDDVICIIGISYRLIKYVKEDDLRLANVEEIEQDRANSKKARKLITQNNVRKTKAIFGRILHIDGDQEYLDSCLSLYEEIGINAEGICLNEKDIYKHIDQLMIQVTPDIVVITGHDSYNGENKAQIDNYENSKYFVKAIRVIRSRFSVDNVVVIAGACASHFEALIASGANFASSPKRINTHTYDPAITAIKVAATSINKVVDFNGILKYIESGRDALGGIETMGKMRLLL